MNIVYGLVLALFAVGAQSDAPTARTIARIEGGDLLLATIRSFGVTNTDTVNRQSRVRVRDVTCRGAIGARAVCSYAAHPCIESDAIPGAGRWCRRTTRFVRVADPTPATASDRGWIIEPGSRGE